jgi:1-acyl-sn-glycerol-3-phosphate acyltransferase
MSEAWYSILSRFIVRLYFSRVLLIHPERRPAKGPVFYVALHRNGAVDGFVFSKVLNDPTFLISTQLTRSWFARLFFHGIPVTRTQDEGSRKENQAGISRCVDHLCAGGNLLVFPEGTSSLGPRHLPFKSGAARILLDYADRRGEPLQVIPAGIHYECPWAFRSRVEVVLGEPIHLELDRVEPTKRLVEIKRLIKGGLEEVGINVESDEQQDRIQRLAYVATLATARSYFESLKALEPGVPVVVADAESRVNAICAGQSLRLHQGVSLVPMSGLWIYVLALVVYAPVVLAALIINLPPVLAGWWAGRKLSDDKNVISLWRILIGFPAFVAWVAALSIVLVFERKFLWLGIYGITTWLGLTLYYRVKKLTVAVYNGIRFPQLVPQLLAFRQIVLDALCR